MSLVRPEIRLLVIGIAWAAWWLAFIVRGKRHNEKTVKMEPKARWGVALQTVGYLLVFAHGPDVWNSSMELWRLMAGIVCALIANAAVWSAVGNLGSQWRVDAGLNRDHELVQTGAYRYVRHPIYASMLGMFLATAFWLGQMPAWPIALVVFVIGMEIRVRIEDDLLRERFGDRFSAWQRSQPAYLPFVR